MMPNTYLTLNHSFFAVRVMGYRMVPVQFDLRVSCVPVAHSDLTHSAAGHRAAVTYQLIKCWMEEMLSNATLADPTTELGEQLSCVCDSHVLFTPGAPDDFVLVRLIHSKCAAIARDRVQILSAALSSSDTDHSERVWTGTEYGLPGIEYAGCPTVHSVPWWQRPTIDVWDHCVREGEQPADHSDPLEILESELSRHWQACEPAEIIDNIWKS